jgi:two-component system response regulator FixJ
MVKKQESPNARVVFVDDDPNLCKTVSRSLERRGFRVRYFTNGYDCLKDLDSNHCDLLITDVRMPGMDGVTLLRQVKDSYPWVAVLVVTGYGDIPLAKKAFKSGADDFIEKPLTTENLMSAVESAMTLSRQYQGLAGSTPTPAESRVLALIMKGMNNRQIADLLHRSVRTVEVHSDRIRKKFGVSNRIDLVRRVMEMRFAKDRQGQ